MSNESAGVAVVTGSGKGIGLAVAKELSARGHRVVISDVDAAAAERAAASIAGAVAIPCDVREEKQVQSLIEQTVERLGAPRVVVPNAGIGVVKPLLMTDLEDWCRVTSVNLDGVFVTMRYAAAVMADNGGGSIVNIASVTATAGSPLIGSYAAAKAGVLSLTKTAATEWRSLGIRVNAVLPGFIATDLVNDVTNDFERMLQLGEGGFSTLIEQKQGRWGTTEDVAKAVAFLASDEQSWVTGTGLTLDGGLTGSLL